MIKISTYGHSVLIASIGLWTVLSFDGLIGKFFGGFIIGLALKMARRSGLEDKDE
jgi:hypothetical protein